MLSFDFSCSGKGEPLFGTGISLNFWHFAIVLMMINLFFSVQMKKCAKVTILFRLPKRDKILPTKKPKMDSALSC
jgi:hypothetical protein